MESSYMKLLSGSTRIRNYVCLELTAGYKLTPPLKDVVYAEVSVLGVLGEDGKLSQEVKRNQHVWIQAAGSVEVKGQHFVEVEPNSKLAEFGQVQGMYRLHPGSERTQLGFWFTARKDTNLADFGYAVRIYMPT